jgi:glycine betaine catabolism A
VTREALTKLEAGLPAAWYHDPAHYQRELEAFWYGRWVAVARAEEIPAPGDWRVIAIASQKVIVLRGEDGGLRAFHNTCRHRGSVLCTENQGSFARRRIVCPYHSWTYDLNGRLLATPRRMKTPDFRLEDFPLHGVAVATWAGFVFVNLDRDTAPLDVGGLEPQFRRYRLAELRIGKRVIADVRANWKLIAENFSECFHCPPVHPELCRVVTAYRDAGAWGLSGAEQRSEYAAGAQTLTLDGTARFPPISSLNQAERQTLYVPAMLPPALFLNVQPDYVNAHMMVPTGPESVRIVYDWLFEPERLPLPEADLQHYVGLWDITNRQDARNCEWQQEGMRSRAFEHGWYVPQEFDCHRFAQWVRAGLAGRA